VKKYLFPLLFLATLAFAETTKTVYSPFTGKLDYITSMGGSAWPSANSSGCLANDGSGNLSWAACSGGGSSGVALAVTTGTSTGFTVTITSPASAINFDNTAFGVTLKGGATAYVTSTILTTTNTWSAQQTFNQQSGTSNKTPFSITTVSGGAAGPEKSLTVSLTGSPSTGYGTYVTNLSNTNNEDYGGYFQAQGRSTGLGNNNYAVRTLANGQSATNGDNAYYGVWSEAAGTSGAGNANNIAGYFDAHGGAGNYGLIVSSSGQVLVQSSATFSSTSGVSFTGPISCSSATFGIQVAISSNTVLPGTTFYQNANATIGISGSTTTIPSITNHTGVIQLSGSAGTSGQVLTSAGATTVPTWTTPSTGGGVSVYQSTATAGFPFGFTASTFTANAANLSLSSFSVTGANGFVVTSTSPVLLGTSTLTSTSAAL
jgi:hypothetical protein